ncbi:hypothetical protein AB6A40_002095 [Gnathostoma spinigerum]|uniref:Nucleoporin NSP1-like C-terminal domain-containing protein n=1 Tax=Gnathostoma spinigerum TaxID=75299 RepID=A0ABD6EDD2_9BILA
MFGSGGGGGFKFGGSATTTTTTTTSKQPSFTFGQVKTAGSAGFTFGQTATTTQSTSSAPTSTESLFSSAVTSTNAKPTSFTFGGASGSSAEGSVFGGFSVPATISQTSLPKPASGTFTFSSGLTTGGAGSTPGFLFAGTTPAMATTASSVFGGLVSNTTSTPKTTPTPLFGQAVTTAKTTAPVQNLFAAPTSTAPATSAVASTAVSTQLTSFSFGTPTTTTTTIATAAFGVNSTASGAPSTPSLFGQPQTQVQTATMTPSSGLFSFGTSAAPTVTSVSAAPSSSAIPAFGMKPGTEGVSGASVFGKLPVPTPTQDKAGAPTTAQPQPSSLFGTSAASSSSGGLLFNPPSFASSTAVTQSQPVPAHVAGFSFEQTTSSAQSNQSMTSLNTASPSLPSLSFGSVPGTASSAKVTLAGTAIPVFGMTTPSVSLATSTGTQLATSFQPTSSVAVTTVPTVGLAFGLPVTGVTTSTAMTTSVALPTISFSSMPSAKSVLASVQTSAPSTTAAGTVVTKSVALTTTVMTSSAITTLPTPAAGDIEATKAVTFSQLEQLLNRLTMDVESQERLFMNQVLELNAYDRVLRENQQKIFAVSEEVKHLEDEKDHYIHAIDFLAQQQTELESLVVELEKALGLGDWTEMAPIGLPDPSMATQADNQRQAIMKLQTHIDAQLKQADDDISDIVDQVAELQNAAAEDDSRMDTVEQITQILRRQLESLNWVDRQSEEIKKKVEKLSAELLSV